MMEVKVDKTGRVEHPCRTCKYLRINEGTRTYYCILLDCVHKANMDIMKITKGEKK